MSPHESDYESAKSLALAAARVAVFSHEARRRGATLHIPWREVDNLSDAIDEWATRNFGSPQNFYRTFVAQLEQETRR